VYYTPGGVFSNLRISSTGGGKGDFKRLKIWDTQIHRNNLLKHTTTKEERELIIGKNVYLCISYYISINILPFLKRAKNL
jgi:hypothetical protein